MFHKYSPLRICTVPSMYIFTLYSLLQDQIHCTSGSDTILHIQTPRGNKYIILNAKGLQVSNKVTSF